MSFVQQLEDRIYEGYHPTQEDALKLYREDLQKLKTAACNLRRVFSSNQLCFRGVVYPPKGSPFSVGVFQREARMLVEHGARRVHAYLGRIRFTPEQLDEFCLCIRNLRNQGISIGVSHGSLTLPDFEKIRKAGCTWYHELLGLPRRLFSTLKHSTLPYDAKIQMLKLARKAGLEISTGGFFDLNETIEDRIQLIWEARELGAYGFLIRSPEWQEEKRNWISTLSHDEVDRSIAITRFLLPKSCIIIDYKSSLFSDQGRWLLESGANGILSGISSEPFLVTAGGEMDIAREMGFVIC